MSGFFTVNHSEAGSSFEPIPEGTYEAFISEVVKHTYSTGSKGLKITITIRDDVDQEAKRRKIFDNLVSSEKAMFRWQMYAAATDLPEGTTFKDEEDLIKGFGKHLKGKPVKIKIVHDTTRDRFPEQVSGVVKSNLGGAAPGSNPFAVPGGSNQQPPSFGEQKMPWEDDGKPVDISDDELPF